VTNRSDNNEEPFGKQYVTPQTKSRAVSVARPMPGTTTDVGTLVVEVLQQPPGSVCASTVIETLNGNVAAADVAPAKPRAEMAAADRRVIRRVMSPRL
jgi:hypothetical protein